MARTRKKPNQQLAESLKIAKSRALDGVLKANLLERAHKERLIKAGCLIEVIRGWYLLTSPEASNVGSTVWFSGFWSFAKHYLNERFGENEYCVSAESSLNLHAGDTTIPKQIVILTKKESNSNINLIYETSIFLRSDVKNFPRDIEHCNGISIMSLPLAICRLSSFYYKNFPRNIEIVLKMSKLSPSDISRSLLTHQSPASAERIIGAYKQFNELAKAKQIYDDLKAADFKLNEVNPFEDYIPKLGSKKVTSPHAARIRLMWEEMRETVEKIMPLSKGVPLDSNKIISIIQETYVQDAYHSLSIEGYQITEDLIEKIENGNWDPENNETDKRQKDALATKGYFEAFKAVVLSIRRVLNGVPPGKVLEEDLQKWYRELFAPSLKANLIPPERIVGYRNSPVYITNSRHVPPPRIAILDCMETFFELLKNEPSASVRAVLGHFIFVFIHPYFDGNGRIGRFILNLMLISGGFNWTIIRVEKRTVYMNALEEASTKENIIPFAEFIKSEIEHWK